MMDDSLEGPVASKIEFDAVVRGMYGTGNFGDDALMVTVVRALRRRAYKRVALICRNAEYIEHLMPGEVAAVLNPGRNVSAAARVYVLGGGTQIFSFEGVDYLLRKLRDAVSSPLQFATRRLIGKVGHSVRVSAPRKVMLGVGFGPFRSVADETRRLRSVADFDSVLVRDSDSWRYASRHGRAGATARYTDMCFSTEALVAMGISSVVTSDKQRAGSGVAFIVRDWRYSRRGAAHVQRAIDLATAIKAEGTEPTFVFFGADRESKAAVKSRGFKYVAWNPDVDTIANFTKRLAGFDQIVTSRYHGVVFSILLGIPCLIIELERKLALAHEDSKGASELWRDDFDVSQGLAAFRRVQNISAFDVQLVRERYVAIADRMMEVFDATL